MHIARCRSSRPESARHCARVQAVAQPLALREHLSCGLHVIVGAQELEHMASGYFVNLVRVQDEWMRCSVRVHWSVKQIDRLSSNDFLTGTVAPEAKVVRLIKHDGFSLLIKHTSRIVTRPTTTVC